MSGVLVTGGAGYIGSHDPDGELGDITPQSCT